MSFRGAVRGRPDPSPHQEGFTLIEVIVASVILLVVLVPTAALLNSSSGFVTQAKAQTEAAHLASGLLEQDRASAAAPGYWPDDEPSLVDTQAIDEKLGNLPFSVVQSGGWCAEVSGEWESYSSSDPPTGQTEEAYGVKAEVRWQDGSQNVTLTTLLTTPATVSVPSNPPTSCPLAQQS